MTTRAKNNPVEKLETDIEKNREESNWSKVIEHAEHFKEKSPQSGQSCDFIYEWTIEKHLFYIECLSNFLIGEGKLENYLEEYPPVEANIHRAKLGLIESKKYLQLAANELGRKVHLYDLKYGFNIFHIRVFQAGVALDAHLLLGKLHYACGQYSESLKSYNLAELHGLTEKHLPV